MNSTKTAIEQALSYDPLAAAEDATGQSYKTDGLTLDLGMLLHFDHSKQKEEVLRQADDTHFRQSIEEFIALLHRMGFEQVLCEDIPETEDKYRIFWRAGVLLSFDSYWGDKSVNGGSAYLFYKGPRSAIFHGSSGLVRGTDDDPVWDVSFDVREGLRFRLDELSGAGLILPEWPAERFIWLLHYKDAKREGYDYVAITKARIERLPEHVRAALRSMTLESV